MSTSNTLKTEVNNIKMDVAILNGKVDNLDKKIEDQKTSIIQGLEPYFTNLDKNIENHQDSIDILSALSFQHEVDFKSIKRLLTQH
ncbi:hypothetical protein [Psychrobacillus sp. L4]|uniref:hypothetical protein n=1 Tax=Psychrobacillus sp. L4 TaxID=3236892 RepID=UPI0036F21F6D